MWKWRRVPFSAAASIVLVVLLAGIWPSTTEGASAPRYKFEVFEGPTSYFTIRGLNNTGQISGVTDPNEGWPFGFVGTKGGYVRVDALTPTCCGTYVGGINDAGVTVGNYLSETFETHSFIRSSTGTIAPFDVPDATRIVAAAINNRNQVVGSADFASGRLGFFGSGAQYTYFDAPPGVAPSGVHPAAVNDAGQIVGSTDLFELGKGFFYDDGLFSLIEIPGAERTYANGINNDGTIVGTFYRSGFAGFIKTDGIYYQVDLPGFDGLEVSSINDNGQIAGTAFGNGPALAFIGTPCFSNDAECVSTRMLVPEPATWIAVLLGIIGFALHRAPRWRQARSGPNQAG